MNIKKLTVLGLMSFTLFAPAVLTGCVEITERVEVERDVDPAPVVVPDRDVDVNIKTDNQDK